MFLFSKINGKQYDYEIKKVFKNKWNDTSITALTISYKEKDNSYTSVVINIWGVDLNVNGHNFATNEKGDSVIVFGANKICLGKVYNNKQPITLYCDNDQIAIIKATSEAQPIMQEMQLIPIDNEALPF